MLLTPHSGCLYNLHRKDGIDCTHTTSSESWSKWNQIPSNVANHSIDLIHVAIHHRRTKRRRWHFQAWNLTKYGSIKHHKDVLKIKLNLAKVQKMTPFYASALKAWSTVNLGPTHQIRTEADQLRIPFWNSVYLNTRKSDNHLRLDTK